MSLDRCQRCSSERLYAFESDGPADAAALLPQVCRACGAIHVEGEVLELGVAAAQLEDQARSMAGSAAEAGRRALAELERDPGRDIAAYFAKHYAKAYLDGFFRSYAFYRHEGKVGRLKRLRELWRGVTPTRPPGSMRMTVTMRDEVYAEIDQLLSLGDPDAASRANIRSPGKSNPA